jgi:hypothetical protein
MSTMTIVHAGNAGGSFTGGQPPATTLANGTMVAKGQFIWKGILSGDSNWTEYDTTNWDGSGVFHGVDMFTGSFNGSKSGSMDSQYSGGYSGTGPFQGTESWSGGTGGLTGLHLETTWNGVGNCNAMNSCSFTGTYVVTSATWENAPVPEFSNLALLMVLMLFASVACLTTLKRKKIP